MKLNTIEIATSLIYSIEDNYGDTVGPGMAQIMIEPIYKRFGARFIAECVVPKDYINFTDSRARELFQMEYMRKLDEAEAQINDLMSRPAEPQDLLGD